MIRIYPSQVWELALASLRARYRSAWAGFFWVTLNPLMLFGVQAYVFDHVLHLQVDRYPLFLLSGLLPWVFILQSFEMCTPILVHNAVLLKSFPIHPVTTLLAQILDNALNFLIAYLLLLIPVAHKYQVSALSFALLAPCLLVLVFNVASFACLLAFLHVFFRDTRYIVSFAMSLAFFITPIFYPLNLVPESFRWIVFCNPIFYMIEPFRVAFYEVNMTVLPRALGISAISGFVFFAFAFLVWRKGQNAIYNNL